MMHVYSTPLERYSLVKGPLMDWLKEHRIPALWTPAKRGWHIRNDRLPDVLVQASLDGLRVKIHGGDS